MATFRRTGVLPWLLWLATPQANKKTCVGAFSADWPETAFLVVLNDNFLKRPGGE